ncbi:MAG: hypothetical protein A3H69_02095 [Candidatus Sungbacteria bacterium RIFCSPLOWO2_02_FULL_47_9]|uniref:Type I restriction enzyme R protein N-terminal domain-containing protein n=1 Tax=Candidatus Sungbacteria bacterium RIFCSPHIGHO2_01_FULL_47_32 TaxID=1802264 RepID=A0A1G2K4B9_9BACT|nr:MAG: hypothetical protein UX72_C0001G0035 [Parcubacteria group bacterium GW2011_GWA2_47_10]OGZ94257.1 MAG: hypothetical protein A2633_05605 [Candidatus Sungbacteria bacterium RIFCSPHIGHO2_01_FULL_47_32]OGZ99726.1 MAG: hypothetical protein A3D57_02395 [Candidatus Sungbacteria bacterium RIFCSPHIGHO2_02_FULL_46_12]OHA05898.1 MAG: hypothetical protein A3A28_02735 [Candidatus Sungbacteria bacterium RIFCSPLOWO2_01_FULL_47_32]OHA08604.1 MAG: hypothetical protein A3H69_02095 [Candidatus Sungbacteria
MTIEFSRKLIKGRIVEVIFEQMIREEGRYTVIPFGYEHTMPTLAQYRNISEVPNVIDNISDAPDFALISEDKTKLFLVEVKYQRTLDIEELSTCGKKLLDRRESPWVFVATPNGFYCAPCSSVCRENKIGELSKTGLQWNVKQTI